MKRLFAHMRPLIYVLVLAASLLAVVGFLAIPQSAAMVSFTVNTTVDSVDVNPGDGVCADSSGNCSLRAAIMEANAGSGAHTINVPAGTYTLTLGGADDEFNLDGAEQGTGDLDILNNDLTITGAGSGITIIDGGGIDRVFDVNNFSNFGTPVNATFNDLTIRNGHAPTSPDGYFEPGGAIQFDGTDNTTGDPVGVLTINNCEISGNTASGSGGGIWAGFGSLIINGSAITANSSVHAAGGGILYNGSSASGLRTLQISNSTLSTNHANSSLGSGGGIWESGTATKTIDHSVITNNTSGAQGGGAFNANGDLALNLNVIVGNTSADGGSTGFRNNLGTIDAANNWWGCNQGPGLSPCDRASGPLGFGITQWLTLHHSASPNPIQINQSTTLQADFFNNNIGSPIAMSDLTALNSRAVTFNNPILGTISGAGSTIAGGKANATFNAGSTGGNGSADATVDHATVTASIEIDQPAGVGNNPTDLTVCEGATATFTASSNGFPTPTVQWQVSTNSGASFSDIPGATTTTLSFPATVAQNGNQYRAVFTNNSGTATTNAATLTVHTGPAVTTNPVDQTACDNTTATFTAAASGDPAPTVQWQVSTGGPFGDIPGATSTTLSFTATAAQNGNRYRAVFTNSCGFATTTAATLTVNASTSTSALTNQTVCPGVDATFSTTASGTGPFTYAWTVDGSPFGGNTSSINVPTGSLSSGNHSVSVTVTGACGSATQSATLTVQESTSATAPGDQSVCQGASASFSTTASGTGPFSYAWTVDGSPFGGDASSINVPTGSLSIGNHSVSVIVTGTCGSSTKTATLTVQENTAATTPADQTVCPGVNANFSTTATGTGPFSYAWTVDGSPFGGNTSSISVPTGSLSAGNHAISVTVSGTCGSVTKNATLTVQQSTSATDLSNQTVCPGVNANFSTTASGTGPFSYAWTVDGSPFGGNTSSVSVPTGSLSSGNHSVSVTVTGACGSVVKNATLTVNQNTATSDPADQTACLGGTVSFTTSASGTGPFAFIWKKGATVLNNGDLGGRVSIVNGASTSTLTITNVQAGDFGTYTVETSGSCNTATQSASLAVNSAPPTIVLNGQSISLWPPDHTYHTVSVTDLVSSATSCDGSVNLNSVVIEKVTSDEAEDATGGGDGVTLNDIVISCDRKSVQLRAERAGEGDGRVYTIYFKVTDSLGHSTTVTATVTVPHDQYGKAVDSGPHYTVTNTTCP